MIDDVKLSLENMIICVINKWTCTIQNIEFTGVPYELCGVTELYMIIIDPAIDRMTVLIDKNIILGSCFVFVFILIESLIFK